MFRGWFVAAVGFRAGGEADHISQSVVQVVPRQVALQVDLSVGQQGEAEVGEGEGGGVHNDLMKFLAR